MKEVYECELPRSRPCPYLALVRCCNQAQANGELLGLAPHCRDLDAIDPASPGVPLGERRLIAAIGALQLEEAAGRELPELEELPFDGGEEIPAELPFEIGPEEMVARVGVGEPGTLLHEDSVHGWPSRYHLWPMAINVRQSWTPDNRVDRA